MAVTAEIEVIMFEGGDMKLFLDTADVNFIRSTYSMINADGVITNPSLISRSQSKYGSAVLDLKVIGRFIDEHGGRLHVQTVGRSYEDIMKDASFISEEFGSRTVVRIPVSREGLAAMSSLSSAGVEVAGTAVYTFSQALLAVKAGAGQLTVYAGRMEENGLDYQALVRLLKKAVPDVFVLVASIHSHETAERAAEAGADGLAYKPELLFSEVGSLLVSRTMDGFAESWKNAYEIGKFEKI